MVIDEGDNNDTIALDNPYVHVYMNTKGLYSLTFPTKENK